MRKDHVVPALDEWIGNLFDPAHIDGTVAALLRATDVGPVDCSRAEAARRLLDQAETYMANLITAIEDGNVPADMLKGRMDELHGQRLHAERELAAATPAKPAHEADIRRLLADVGPIADVLAGADPAAKALLYADLDLRLTFHPEIRTVDVKASPPDRGLALCRRGCRRGDLNSPWSRAG
jgi:hypothetical protein